MRTWEPLEALTIYSLPQCLFLFPLHYLDKLENVFKTCPFTHCLLLTLLQYYDDYGDIIKATLGKAREINKVNSARTMALALTMIFRELQKDNGRINRQSADFISLKVCCCLPCHGSFSILLLSFMSLCYYMGLNGALSLFTGFFSFLSLRRGFVALIPSSFVEMASSRLLLVFLFLTP